MRFKSIRIKNYKGIEDITLPLSNKHKGNIFAIVGLNESGKTTILEAINAFSFNEDSTKNIGVNRNENVENWIPIHKRHNFNGQISISIIIELDDSDKRLLLQHLNHTYIDQYNFLHIHANEILVVRKWEFKNSTIDPENNNGILGVTSTFNLHEKSKKKFVANIKGSNTQVWNTIARKIRDLIPSIIYFPNFLFDFPVEISLRSKGLLTKSEQYYYNIMSDVLASVDPELNLETHIIPRIVSSNQNENRTLKQILSRMSQSISTVVLTNWTKVMGNEQELKNVTFELEHSYYEGEDPEPFLTLEMKSGSDRFLINERSTGFKWFFTFILFTQFKAKRHSNILFVFDEPASNLHSTAQEILLTTLEKLSEKSMVIYTTHSQHLVSVKWLENTYVAVNDVLKDEEIGCYEYKVSLIPYKRFFTENPTRLHYCQPILDLLKYRPSDLELPETAIFVEGKYDFYTYTYINTVYLPNKCYNIKLTPGVSSSAFEFLISLYIGWGKNYYVIFDSDKAGLQSKENYFKKFGRILEGHLFTLEDINPEFKNMGSEYLIPENERLAFQKIYDPDSKEYNKSLFNDAIQEALVRRDHHNIFSESTLNKFDEILQFMHKLRVNT